MFSSSQLDNRTALYMASTEGHASVVSTLLLNGADTEISDKVREGEKLRVGGRK